MSWVSRKRRFGSYLALAGLALQVILSFGHLHLDGLSSRSAGVTAANVLRSQSPAQHPANDADDYCAICATIHLASTSFLPDAPLLPVPFASRTIEHFRYFALIFVSPRRAAFQSRAPPLA